MRVFLLTLTLLLAAPTAARADDVASYAIVVGSNAGGPGQQDLQYAERDAKRVAGSAAVDPGTILRMSEGSELENAESP